MDIQVVRLDCAHGRRTPCSRSTPPSTEPPVSVAATIRGRFAAGPLLVIAGAGTGKTNTLAHRVAHLVLEGVDPARILLLTFTRRASLEMISRAERIVGASLAGRRPGGPMPASVCPGPGTFHSIGEPAAAAVPLCRSGSTWPSA